jgi:ankyrin repeat protein
MELPNLDELGVAPQDKEEITNAFVHPRPRTDSPLHLSISKQYPLLTEWLIRNDADVNATNETNQTPLHCAIIVNNIHIVRELVYRGADVNAAIDTGENPLHHAAMETGEMVNFFLDRGVDINAKSSYGTALHYAVAPQNNDTFRALILRGANFRETNSSHETPIQQALTINANSIINTFLEIIPIDTPIDDRNNTLLHHAVIMMKLDVISELLRRGASCISLNSDNKTPLHLLLEHYTVPNVNPPTMLNLFLSFMQRYINNPIDVYGNILLHYALFINCDTSIIDLLLQNGSDVNAINAEGNTPIFYYKSYRTLSKLLEYRHIDAPINNKGITLLQHACNENNANLIIFLKKNGADGTGIVCNDIILHELAVKPYVDNPPGVYVFKGHGCDSGIERIVPPNCLYITLAICGENINEKYGFTTRLMLCGAMLNNPKQYQKEIETMLGRGIYIYDEGTPYNDVQYSIPLLNDIGNDRYVSGISGLHHVEHLHSNLVNIHTGDMYMHKTYTFITVKGDPANPDVFNKIYGNSLLPSIPREYKGATAKDTYRNFPRGHIQQSSLFKIYPGIYYNLACRGPCKSNVPPVPQLHRTRSIGRRNTIAVKQIKEWFDANESTAVEQLDRVIEDPSIYFVEDYPGEFDEVVGKHVTRLTGPENKERVRIIVRGGRKKKRTKRKRV